MVEFTLLRTQSSPNHPNTSNWNKLPPYLKFKSEKNKEKDYSSLTFPALCEIHPTIWIIPHPKPTSTQLPTPAEETPLGVTGLWQLGLITVSTSILSRVVFLFGRPMQLASLPTYASAAILFDRRPPGPCLGQSWGPTGPWNEDSLWLNVIEHMKAGSMSMRWHLQTVSSPERQIGKGRKEDKLGLQPKCLERAGGFRRIRFHTSGLSTAPAWLSCHTLASC